MAVQTHTDTNIHRQLFGPPKVAAPAAGLEAAVGAAAAALAIVGLAGVASRALLAIATIAAGVGLLLRGLGVGTRIKNFVQQASERAEELTVEGGLTVEVIAGIGGVVLGILALLDVAPTVLVPAALTAFGAALLIGAGVTRSVASRLAQHEGRTVQVITELSEGGDILIGVGVATLGILGLIGLAEQTLSLAGMIAVGAGLMLEASPVLSRVFGV